MRILSKAHDGSKDSGVTGYYLIEIKALFSIVLLYFEKGISEYYHNHAFNALTFWLTGPIKEWDESGFCKLWYPTQLKYTPRSKMHRIEAFKPAWALSFRGPWKNYWQEKRPSGLVTLTHGRKEIT